MIEIAGSPPAKTAQVSVPSPTGSGGDQQRDWPQWAHWPDSAAGGACACEADHILTWSIPAGSSDLTLLGTSLSGTSAGAAARLSFQAPLLPAVASVADAGGTVLYVFTRDGALHCITVPAAADDARRSHDSQKQTSPATSPIHGLLDSKVDAIRSVVVPDAAALGAPAALAAVDGVICIGGSSGSIRCTPQSCFAATDPTPPEDAATLMHRCSELSVNQTFISCAAASQSGNHRICARRVSAHAN